MGEHFDVLIVGAGHGGAAAAMALRQAGFAGSVGLIGAEPELPYDRPSLSKDYLAGVKPFERMVFRSREAWTERGVALRLGCEVVRIDAEARVVTGAAGEAINYGQLIWAAGGTPRRLPCKSGALTGVHQVRARADVDAIRAELPTVRNVVVVGGGYVGLEAAAVLSGLGKQVCVVEAGDRVLMRVAGEPLSQFYEAEHRARGVEVRTGALVESILGEAEHVAGVRLAGGEVLAAQMVIVGIGIEPAVGPLAAAGAECYNGVRVDGQCRTSLPGVFAIGDGAEHCNAHAGDAWVRIESVQNATDQAGVATRAICGSAGVYEAVPWFWSNQYDLKLQTVGLMQGADELVMRGDPATRSFSLVYLRKGRVVALDCVNAVKDYVAGRALVAAGARPERETLADVGVALKDQVRGDGSSDTSLRATSRT